MVTLAIGSKRETFIGSVRVTVNPSELSIKTSLSIGTVNVWLVTPERKVSDPDVLV